MTSHVAGPDSVSWHVGERKPIGLIVAALSWLGVSLALYRPYLSRPYDVQDFPELVLMIRQGSSVFDAIVILSEYILSHGRLNLVVVSQFVLKWKLFGEDMALWNLARAFEMCLLAVLLFLLLRTLGSSRPGAFVASTIVLASPPAAQIWSRTPNGEPMGAIVLVLLGLLLCHSPDERISRSRLVALSLTVIILGLIKEVLLVAVPIVTLSILGFKAGARASLALFVRDPRVHAVVIGGVLVAGPVAYAALQAPSQSYSHHFGASSVTGPNFLMPLLATLLPFAPTSSPLSVIEILAIAAYIAGIVGVWGSAMKDRSFVGRGWFLLFALGLPLAGALVYSAWPKYRLYHALPFQLGTAMLIGVAVSRLLRMNTYVRVATFTACAIIAAPMLTFAHGYLSFQDASRRLTHDTAVWLGRLSSRESASVEVCGLPLEHFSGYGYFLRNYSLSLGLAPPPVQQAACVFEPTSDGRQTSAWRVMLSDRVPIGEQNGASIVYLHSAFNLRTFRLVPDSIIVTTWPPA